MSGLSSFKSGPFVIFIGLNFSVQTGIKLQKSQDRALHNTGFYISNASVVSAILFFHQSIYKLGGMWGRGSVPPNTDL